MNYLLRYAVPILGACLFTTGLQAQQRVPLPVTAEEATPRPPVGLAASFVPPPRDASGRYRTVNADLTTNETVWHVRAALNVAALACRDAEEVATVAAYNTVLAGNRAALAAAFAGMNAEYQVRYGAAAQNRVDDAMTALYNFFALTAAHESFCPIARQILAEAQTVGPGAFTDFAVAALPRLEAPFVARFAEFDAYRARLIVWQAAHGPLLTLAPVAAVAVTTAPSASPVTPPRVVATLTGPVAAVAKTIGPQP